MASGVASGVGSGMTNYCSLDHETFLINTDYPEPYGYQGPAPIPVVLALATDKGAKLTTTRQKQWWLKMLASDYVIVGQNLAFDLVVAYHQLGIPLKTIRNKYSRGQIRDTQIRETLLATASGELAANKRMKFNLAVLTDKYLGKDVSADKGPDAWRMRYAELYGVPLEEWPIEAVDYPKQDVNDTLQIFYEQGGDTISPDELNQTRAAFDLQLLSLWAPHVNPERTEDFITRHEEHAHSMDKRMERAGLLTWNPKAEKYKLEAKKLRQYVQLDYEKQGLPVPRTEKGAVQAGAEQLMGCKTPLLREWGETATARKIMEAFAPALRENSGRQICTNYNVLVSTGRTSSWGVNMQQMSKQPGHRECFEPRDPENNVLVAMDYDSFEMFGLAQTVYEEFETDKMLSVLNSGQDPHLMTVADLTGEKYDVLAKKRAAGDKEVEAWRQAGKAYSFGAGGGMAAATFISTMSPDQRATLQTLDPDRALTDIVQESLNAWWKFWELEPLRTKAQRNTKRRSCEYIQPITGRVRRGFTYCSYLNYHFQPRCADAAKRGLQLIVNEIVEDEVVPVAFLHDELVFEGPDGSGLRSWTEKARELMVAGAQEILPDCKMRVGVEVCGKQWSKGGVNVEQWLSRDQ